MNGDETVTLTALPTTAVAGTSTSKEDGPAYAPVYGLVQVVVAVIVSALAGPDDIRPAAAARAATAIPASRGLVPILIMRRVPFSPVSAKTVPAKQNGIGST